MSVFNALDSNQARLLDHRQERLDKAIAQAKEAMNAVSRISSFTSSDVVSQSLGEIHNLLNVRILTELEEEKEKVKEERQEAEAGAA